MNHVLIVDDTPIQLKIAISIMENHGLSVSVASNGREAFKSIEKERPDLILLDIIMPGIDGFEVCSTLKRDPKYADIPILFLTAQTDEENIMTAFQAGAADYVTKPVNPPELLARVHTHLELANTIFELRGALEEVKRLSGLLRICAYCKSIEHESIWVQLEDYLATNSDARLTHCICPTCMEQQLQGEI
ncbi:MAG TPA: response regulator [Mariprofundaceae bacterium]|nr:response regulator [Mariprofundaceae bacterium]